MTEEKLSPQKNFIVKVLKENNNSLDYKKLQSLCENEFEGVRLILKKLKEKNVVDHEGNIPGFNSKIKLI